MVDIDLLTEQLRARGHNIESVIKVPSNAGDYEFRIDGTMRTLDEVRAILSGDEGSPTTAEDERAAAPETSNPSSL